ncbi:MAG TPA: LysR family transcriptional regulator [Verrucomicrobiae bacterium]|nr:LysR family transcriptional regulator [Verrucomicrobiae bacterium]
MKFQQFEIFSAIARHRNVTKAAGELRISQPSITHQIKLLEEELGAKFYRKVLRGIELTDEGQLLLPHIESLMRQADMIETLFRPALAAVPAPLVIGGSSGPAAWFLPSLAARFCAAHPGLEVTIRVASSLAMEKMVQNGEIEIAVLTDHSHAADLVYEPCRREKLVFFGARGGRFSRPKMSVADLGKIPFVLFKKGKAGATAQFFSQMARAGIHANVAMQCESVEGVKNAVREDSGLGLLYRDNLRNEIRRAEIQVIHVPGMEVRIDSSIVYPRRKLSAAAGEFLDLLRRERREAKPAVRAARRKKLAVNIVSLAPLWLPGFIYSLIGQVVEDISLLGTGIV